MLEGADCSAAAHARTNSPRASRSARSRICSICSTAASSSGLDLKAHGLAYAATNIATTALSPSGDHLKLDGAYGETLTGKIFQSDHVAWRELRARLMRFASVLGPSRT